MSMNNSSRLENVYFAKIACRLGRYEEMTDFMNQVVKSLGVDELSVEERNVLYEGYKNLVDPRRNAWRGIRYMRHKEVMVETEDHAAKFDCMISKIEAELSKICASILGLLDSSLIPTASTTESRVFYLKMKGDYNRYLAEFKKGAELVEAKENASSAYNSAKDIALASLPPLHPLRLRVGHNLAVFHYEILNLCEDAVNLMWQALDDATYVLGMKGEEQFQESDRIMEEICVRLSMWNSEKLAERRREGVSKSGIKRRKLTEEVGVETSEASESDSSEGADSERELEGLELDDSPSCSAMPGDIEEVTK